MGFLDFLRGLWSFGSRRRGKPAGPEDLPSAAVGSAMEPPVWQSDGSSQGVAQELDDTLDALFEPSAPSATSTAAADPQDPDSTDDLAARDLFASIAANYSRPVRNFVVELKRGTATKEWIEICQPVMASIIDGAESMGLTEAAARITEFREALALAQASDGRQIDEDSRALILSCYDTLLECLPETFRHDERDQRRESIIMHSLLGQIPGVGHVTFEKLYSSGVTTLDALFLANTEDLASATGVPSGLCERICDKVQEHRGRLEGGGGDGADFDHHGRLVELVKELRRHNGIFHSVSREENPDLAPQKRDALRNRQACALQINVVLAEMGQVDLVEELKKLAVGRRIERLEFYIQSPDDLSNQVNPQSGQPTVSMN